MQQLSCVCTLQEYFELECMQYNYYIDIQPDELLLLHLTKRKTMVPYVLLGTISEIY